MQNNASLPYKPCTRRRRKRGVLIWTNKSFSAVATACYLYTEFARVALLSGARHLVGDLHRPEEVSSHSFRLTPLLLRFQEVVAVRRVPVGRRVALIDGIPAQQHATSRPSLAFFLDPCAVGIVTEVLSHDASLLQTTLGKSKKEGEKNIRQVQCTIAGCQRRLAPILQDTLNI